MVGTSNKATHGKNEKLDRGITIYRGQYRVRISVDGRQELVGVYGTVQEARDALYRARAAKSEGRFVNRSDARQAVQLKNAERAQDRQRDTYTFEQWSVEWLTYLENRKASQATIVTHRSLLRAHILPEIGNKALNDITRQDIEKIIAKVRAIKSKRNPNAIENGITPNVLRTLRACFNVAVRKEIAGLKVSPVVIDDVVTRRVREKDPKGEVATPEEVQLMANAMPENLRVGVYLAAWQAMRLGELLGLQRRDFVNLDTPEEAMLHIERQVNSKAPGAPLTDPKSDSKRIIAIVPSLVPMIREHLDKFTRPELEAPFLVIPGRESLRVSQTHFDVAWRKARAAAGRSAFRFHDLRHTGLTLYAQQGATLAELLHRGGHTDIEVALRYQHATAERDRELTSRLNQRF